MPSLLETFFKMSSESSKCRYQELLSKHTEFNSTTLFASILCKKRLKHKEWREPFAEPAYLFLLPCSLMFLE